MGKEQSASYKAFALQMVTLAISAVEPFDEAELNRLAGEVMRDFREQHPEPRAFDGLVGQLVGMTCLMTVAHARKIDRSPTEVWRAMATALNQGL